ncbi:MAG: hypothetical protein PVF73_01640 [Bacteroidales bacterium]|jgi:hypothetical protein
MTPNVKKIPSIEVKVDELWRLKTTKSGSPSVLNTYGKKILSDSKVADIVSPYYEEIVRLVKEQNPTNPYKVQETLIDVLTEFRNRETIKEELEKAAFSAGSDINTILFVAAIHFRDKVIKELGFNVNEIDQYDPKRKAE